MSTATTGAALIDEGHRCSACRSNDHEREAHYSARKAFRQARAHEEAGNATQARFWGAVAVDLIRREAAERRASEWR